jgi:hypothetical protein
VAYLSRTCVSPMIGERSYSAIRRRIPSSPHRAGRPKYNFTARESNSGSFAFPYTRDRKKMAPHKLETEVDGKSIKIAIGELPGG